MTTPSHLILGIESSCDDTAAAVIRVGERTEVLSSVVVGQDAAHAAYGGVVPEIAARAHAARVDEVVKEALDSANIGIFDIDMISATAGPGLIGGVMSGLTFAKGLAMATDIPLVPINHLAGHALSVMLDAPVPVPHLLLLVSGGHTQIVRVESETKFLRLGTTIDDAAGEAFDKTAKLLGLSGAGGPAIQNLAMNGDPKRFTLPRPLLGRSGCDFSFSGLKTAVRELVSTFDDETERPDADIAASFQQAAVRHLLARTENAIRDIVEQGGSCQHLVAAGGVAANTLLREGLEELAQKYGWHLTVPALQYCTDNAAMIAYAGWAAFQAQGEKAVDHDWQMVPRARWPLDERQADITVGKGRKGRKV